MMQARLASKHRNWRRLSSDNELMLEAVKILKVITESFRRNLAAGKNAAESLADFIERLPDQQIYDAFFALNGDTMPSYLGNPNGNGQESLGGKLKKFMLAQLNEQQKS